MFKFIFDLLFLTLGLNFGFVEDNLFGALVKWNAWQRVRISCCKGLSSFFLCERFLFLLIFYTFCSFCPSFFDFLRKKTKFTIASGVKIMLSLLFWFRTIYLFLTILVGHNFAENFGRRGSSCNFVLQVWHLVFLMAGFSFLGGNTQLRGKLYFFCLFVFWILLFWLFLFVCFFFSVFNKCLRRSVWCLESDHWMIGLL